jgi:hypothetical protein
MDEWSAIRGELYLPTQNTQNIYAPAGFESTISAGEWLQTAALDRPATEIGNSLAVGCNMYL